MASTFVHHVAVRVSDIDRATRFYENVFGGKALIELDLDEQFSNTLYKTKAGVTCKNRFVVCENWSVELFQFVPGEPLAPTCQPTANIMHFCVHSENVDALAQKILDEGGSVCVEKQNWGPYNFMYMHDPDGNVIEIINATVSQCLAEYRKMIAA